MNRIVSGVCVSFLYFESHTETSGRLDTFWKDLAMVYNIVWWWVYGLYPSSEE
jgi:hypothetical protein